MKILVTGGAGFIGSHIVDALIKKNHQVIIIDNLKTGKKENLNKLAKFKNIDIKNYKKIENVFKKHKPEAIFHLAAQIQLRKSLENPLYEFENNVLASINLIELSKKYNVKKFIFSSSAAVYDENQKTPFDEKTSTQPSSPYGISKMTIDKYLEYANKSMGLNYCSLRYSNAYGPRQNSHGESGVIAVFTDRMINGKTCIINGDGKQTRDYIYVDDIVNANLKALKNKKISGIFNVSTNKKISVNQVFNEINKYFDKKFKKNHGPTKKGDVMTCFLNYDKINKEMKWSPKTDFKTGVRKTIKWFKKQKINGKIKK